MGCGLLRRLFVGRRLSGLLVVKIQVGSRWVHAIAKPNARLGNRLIYLPRLLMTDLGLHEGGDAKLFPVAPRVVRTLKFIRIELEGRENVTHREALSLLQQLRIVEKNKYYKIKKGDLVVPAKTYRFRFSVCGPSKVGLVDQTTVVGFY